MTIKFHSNIQQGDQDNVIEFKSSVNLTKDGVFDVYEFKEPQQGIMNRIEVSKDSVNIYAGSSTINLELNKIMKIEYATPSGTIYLNSLLLSLKKTKDKVNFEYTLSTIDTELGRYNLTLTITK